MVAGSGKCFLLGFCFVFSAGLRFCMPEKSITISFLILAIGVCLALIGLINNSHNHGSGKA